MHLYARLLHSTRVGRELVTGKTSNTHVNALNWSDQGKTFVSQPGAQQVHSKKPTAVLPLYLKVNSISKGPPHNICLIGLTKVKHLLVSQVHSKKPTAVSPLYLKVNSISKAPPQNIWLIGL